MRESWRDVVGELAGPDAAISEGVAPEWEGMVVAELLVPGAAFRIPGPSSDEAWGRLAHALADLRLLQSLEAAGWLVIEEVIDETTYVVARDPNGTVWAIGVASNDGDRRGYIERDIRLDARVVDRIAFVEPIETKSAETLVTALRADGQ